MKKFAAAFYGSNAWKECRAAYAKSKGGLCERCLDRGYFSPGEEVHHVIRLTPQNISDPKISLDWSNLRLLCKTCHEEVHRTRKPRRYKIGPDGKVIAID